MRLEKIKLAGFKSFVDPTTVHLKSNLVGVVGPNGSGKSNIIDAVRWVMGESSAKNLRGDSMADVIFNGSTGRKPVGQASIELVFENAQGRLGGKFANFNEISVKRQVTRDGQSTYFLNGTKCRRKDITDIFLGTGLGPRSYAIIEQGMISRLIEAKPEELRNIIEEAAGISKYKERRRETETRIRHTKENLDRINDLREELGKQLERLQRQAKTAEKYKGLKAEERETRGQHLALQWRHLDTETRDQDTIISQLETQLEADIASQRSIEASTEKQREEHTEATDAFNEIQGQYYQYGTEISTKEQSIQHIRERRHQVEQDLQQIDVEAEKAMSHQASDMAQLEELNSIIAELEPQLEEIRMLSEESGLQFEQAEEQMLQWQEAWEDFSSNAGEPAQQAEVERTRITHLEDRSQEFRQRIEKFDQEIEGFDTQGIEASIEELENVLVEIQESVANLQEEKQTNLQNVTSQRELISSIQSELNSRRQTLQETRGRIASLEALQEAALGGNEAESTQWLSSQGLEHAPRLAQTVQVQNGWEKAVETVLGFHLDSVCVDNLDMLNGQLDSLSDLGLGFIERNGGAGNTGSIANALADKVESEWANADIFAGVACADSLEQALALRNTLAANQSIITPEGVWLGQHWLRLPQKQNEKGGVIARERDLKTANESSAQIAEELAQYDEQLEEAKLQLTAYEESREQVQELLSEKERETGNIKGELSSKTSRLEQLNNRRENILLEKETLTEKIEEHKESIQAARAILEQALEAMEEAEERRITLQSERDNHRASLDEAKMLATEHSQSMQSMQIELRTRQASLSSTRQSLERVDSQVSGLNERKEQLSMTLGDSEEPLDDLKEALELLLESRHDIEEQLAESRRRVEAIDHEMRELHNQRITCEQSVQNVRESLEKERLSGQTAKVKRQTIQEQLAEAGYELNLLFETLDEHADIKEWENRLQDLDQRIKRLGAINLAAIEEFAEQQERQQYLDAQLGDLNDALETLESAIRKIDKETRVKFKETFDQVNKGVKEMFPKLFGGGQAYLDLTGEDLLDTGVSIMARPPGKKVSNIHLLSGGEKALTAVALVFSIFELNPAPFCMLDEVDAPLDEANVGRFCNLVKFMSDRVQFIFITHNKATMEISQHLNGVTMHEPGVSRMVAVDVEEAAEMAAM